MKHVTNICFLGILLNLVLAVASRDVRNLNHLDVKDMEERDEEEDRTTDEDFFVTRQEFEAHLATKDDMTGGLVELTSTSVQSAASLVKIDYTQSGGQIAWEVAQAIVPLIGTALSFIPGGVIVSAVFLTLWGILSPVFAPKQENPMEKMIRELAKHMQTQIDTKFSNLIQQAVYAEIARNTYVCNKYSFASQPFIETFKANKTLKNMDAMNLKIYLNDCDNFLKDTAEAFVHDEYADVLWVPGALTTSVRLGFLAELIQNGHLIGLTRNVTIMYFQELKRDIKRQFEFYFKGIDKKYKKIYNPDKYMKNDPSINYFNASAGEMASCTLQNQLFYFDRELYPYGMPTILNNTDMFARISMADHYKPVKGKGGKVKHLQIFFNVTSSTYPPNLLTRKDGFDVNRYVTLQFMNCFLGPMYQKAPSIFWFNFDPVPKKNNHSYEFRLMYLQRKQFGNTDTHKYTVPILSAITETTHPTKFAEYQKAHDTVNKQESLSNRKCLAIEFINNEDPRFNESKVLIDIPGSAYWKQCPYMGSFFSGYCHQFAEMFLGRFKMYSVGTFNHRNEELNPLILIDDPNLLILADDKSIRRMGYGFLVGVEIILRPIISQ